MKTETLNEYIFTRLVVDIAQSVRKRRQQHMESDGVDEQEILNTPLIPEDLRKAIEIIEWERREVSVLLKEFRPDVSE